MKFLFALTALIGTVASKRVSSKTVQLNDVKVDSKLGNSIMSKARKLEQDEEEDFSWVVDYSIKFQGCHHVAQWNDDADDEDDVKIQTKRLIRFRLCPSGSCTANNAGGCSSSYGDYIIDMNEYLEAYLEAVEEINKYTCENLEANVCQCNDDDGNQQDDGFDEDKCLYDCYVSNGVEDICAENNPYEDDEQQKEDEFDVKEYIECAEWEAPEDEDEERRLEEGEEEEEVQYFMGPYCSDNGSAIHIGLFSDDKCTNSPDDEEVGGDDVYYSLTGENIPYGRNDRSLVGMECISCQEPEDVDGNDNNNDDQEEEEARVIEFCEEIYQKAGKCESYLAIDNQNENACTFMEGIKIVRSNGSILSSGAGANKTATIFIGIFIVAFILLAAYVYYLRTKLDRASINLSE